MKERLCPDCIRINDQCWGIKAQDIASDPKKTAIQKHIEITNNRIKARIDGCDKVNKPELDPDYPGRELL